MCATLMNYCAMRRGQGGTESATSCSEASENGTMLKYAYTNRKNEEENDGGGRVSPASFIFLTNATQRRRGKLKCDNAEP